MPSPAADLRILPRWVCSIQFCKPFAISLPLHTHAHTSLASSFLLCSSGWCNTAPDRWHQVTHFCAKWSHPDTRRKRVTACTSTHMNTPAEECPCSLHQSIPLLPGPENAVPCKMAAGSMINFASSVWALLRNGSNACNARNVSFSWLCHVCLSETLGEVLTLGLITWWIKKKKQTQNYR